MTYNSGDPQNTVINDSLHNRSSYGGLKALEENERRVENLRKERASAQAEIDKAKANIQSIKAAAMATWNTANKSQNDK